MSEIKNLVLSNTVTYVGRFWPQVIIAAQISHGEITISKNVQEEQIKLGIKLHGYGLEQVIT